MRNTPLALIGLVAACSLGDSAGRNEPAYRTVVDTIGDTIVVRTSGDVPDDELDTLTVEWASAGGASDTAGSLGDVSGLAVGPDGRVFVWDHATPTLWLFDARGNLVRRVGRPGSGPGEYDRLNGIAARPDGRLVAWDAGNARFNVYNADGSFATSWRLDFGGRITSNAITADTANRIWMRSSVRNPSDPAALSLPAAFLYDTSGVLIDTILVPRYSTDDPFLVARRQEGESRNTSAMGLPYGTYSTYAISPFGHIVSGPGRPYAVNTEQAGRAVRIEREAVAVPVPSAEREQLRARAEFSLRRTQPDWRWDARDVPTEKPPYAALTVAQDGRIWVQLHVPSEEFEPDPPSAAQTNPPPAVRFRPRERRWDVYEPDGRYRGRIVGSRLFTPYVMRGDTVWGVLRDENDVPSVARMRVRGS